MIEGGNWDQRLYRASTFAHLHVTPPRVKIKSTAGKLGEQPISVCTTSSKLQLVSDGAGDATSPLNLELSCSPVSQLHFASPEETVTPITPVECELPLGDSFLSLSTPDSSSPCVHEEPARMTSDGQSPLATHTAAISQPGRVMPRLDGSATSDSNRIGRRPLPEVPGHAQSRPLPPRPIKAATVPGWRGPDRFSYPPCQEFVQGCSKDPLVALRPVSDSGSDTSGQVIKKEQPNHDPAPEDIPPVPRRPATPTTISLPALLPSSPTLPSPFPDFPVPPVAPVHSSVDLLSPTSIDLVTAAGSIITGEDGEQISFGALFGDRKVAVIFVRYFWCLCCQDYVRTILNSTTPDLLEHMGVDLILIGNGIPGAIRVYKKVLKIPFKVYTDPSLKLYDALGLYKTSNVQTEGLSKRDSGNWSKRDGLWTSLRIAVREVAAKRVHDDLERLGGEFVFGPGLKSSFVHKMQSPGGHAPIAEVLEAAGVEVFEKVKVRGADVEGLTPTESMSDVIDIGPVTNTPTPESLPTPVSTAISFSSVTPSAARALAYDNDAGVGLGLTIPVRVAGLLGSGPPTPIIADETEWMVHRGTALVKIKQKREARRKGGVV